MTKRQELLLELLADELLLARLDKGGPSDFVPYGGRALLEKRLAELRTQIHAITISSVSFPEGVNVSVQLTNAGKAAAQGGSLSVHGAGVALTFVGDKPQHVPLYIWHEILKKTVSARGQRFFKRTPQRKA